MWSLCSQNRFEFVFNGKVNGDNINIDNLNCYDTILSQLNTKLLTNIQLYILILFSHIIIAKNFPNGTFF
jgi:hypothetical protein